MRSLLVVVFIIFLTSCSSKLAYNNLDWWVYWYLDDYVELNERNYSDNTPEELKSVLDDVGLGLEVRRNIDRRIGDRE